VRAKHLEGRIVGVFCHEEDHIDAEDEQDESVADVSEHHSEEEGECDHCEEGRVGLLVVGHSVGLHDFLS